MPTPLSPRRHIPATLLKSSLHTAKPIILADTTATAPNTRNPRAGPLPISTANLRALSWSPLGNRIATADSRCVRVWNPEKPNVRFSTELKSAADVPGAPGGRARGVPPSLAGTERVGWNPGREAELASVGNDGLLRFWDVRARGACVGSVNVEAEGYSLCWRPDGEEVVVGRKDDAIVRVSRRMMCTLSYHAQGVQTNQIAFSNSGNELFLTTGDSQIKIVDYPSMKILKTLTPHTSSVTSVAPSPTGRHIALGGSDALLTLWSTSSLCCTSSFTSLPGPVRNLSFSWDGAFIVAGCDEGGAAPSTTLSSISGSSSFGGGASTFAPAGGATGGSGAVGTPEETGVKIYGVESGEEIAVIETKNVPGLVEWHPNRYAIAWAGEAGGVRVVSL